MFSFLPVGIMLECYFIQMLLLGLISHNFFFLLVVILHTVTVSICYDEKTKINKQGGLTKPRRVGKTFQKIRNVYFLLGTEE